VATAFSHGAYFVSLASVSAETGVVTALLDSLQVTGPRQFQPFEQLQEFLRDRELLLVLDNFEHMLGQVILLQQLLTTAPQVKLLVTSRARLNLTAEHAIGIEGLLVPGSEVVAGDELRTFSSVRLFLQRAAQNPWGFEGDPETLQAVAAICRLLDGLPLGIEMAASWVEHYTCQEIAAAIRAMRLGSSDTGVCAPFSTIPGACFLRPSSGRWRAARSLPASSAAKPSLPSAAPRCRR
jgi:predicted ATPase